MISLTSPQRTTLRVICAEKRAWLTQVVRWHPPRRIPDVPVPRAGAAKALVQTSGALEQPIVSYQGLSPGPKQQAAPDSTPREPAASTRARRRERSNVCRLSLELLR